MTKPVYKIEVYDPTPTLRHTITQDALTVYFKEILTDGVGHFLFSVPTKKNGSTYYYNDIALNDMVKIWVDYDSVSGNPHFIGKVYNISAPLSTQQGYMRLISGLSQGEVLLRRLKKQRLWDDNASTIVTEVADDLGLGTNKIESDTTNVDLESEARTYMDVLQRVSDYWKTDTVKIQKDFYVDVDTDLVWATRDGTSPFRSGASVETFTVGENILHYKVNRGVTSVKNNIFVWGAKFDTPSNHDWAEDAANWTSDGTVTESSDVKVGTVSIQGQHTEAAPADVYLQRTFSSIKCGWKNHRYVNFWIWINSNGTGLPGSRTIYVDVLAPDTTNRFSRVIEDPELQTWVTSVKALMELGPHGTFTKNGNADWEDVQGIRFFLYGESDCTTATLRVDGLYFSDAHYQGSATDGTTPQRDLEVTDPSLLSNAQCTSRAETLLMMKQNAPIQVELTVPGNNNVLLGDRLSITIPAENLSAVDFDVFAVEQSLSGGDRGMGWLTKATMVNTVGVRKSTVTNQLQALVALQRKVVELAKNEKYIA